MQFLHGAENKMLILFSCKKLIQLTMKQWKAEWGAPLELAHGSSNSRGVAILFRRGFDCKIIKKLIDPNSPAVKGQN